MNFLQISQFASQWSGKGAATLPATVVGQVGLALDIVTAVQEAWRFFQNKHSNWQWMRAEFSATLAAVVPPTQARYTPAALGISRFGDFVYDQVGAASSGVATYRPMSLYDPTIGLANEGTIPYVDWEPFRTAFFRGAQTQQRPSAWTADPAGNFCLGQAPDKTYVLKGEYFKNEQLLAADLDTPECPSQFHTGIGWRAVLILTEKDEADQAVYDRAENKYSEVMGALESSQLPHIVMGGSPIA